ncbi:VSP [Giardia duodenalis]|uniref:VSP n=1 Tax=Giardia intestinalis (strain ATCC 50803 / WB clone C6) TaxID=184922 RepID=A8C008_GIAIC|nr:uncharacterized protein GL50803_00114674 [Giardia intestinalis]KAE8303325.1 VSP [Giardia intestinalis]|eukprot:XP_001703945.1 Hypothetical protein GL50803_114674 [Giardia lamblia ATCC 50803]
MFQLIPLFVASALMAACQQDGNHLTTCAHEKCETVGSTEICTQCKAGGVPVDGFCRPFGSPQAAAAGCTKADGAALDKTATTCEKCGDGYFLFMGGCYKTTDGPGSEICTAASNGVCTTCKADNGLFKNPVTPQKPGSECILCSDTIDRNGVMGVAGCSECSHTGTSGPATCTECQAGFVTKDSACVKCGDGCSACSADTPTQCTACVEGKFLKDGNTCVEATECGADKYADKKTWTCKACDPDIAGCTACEYNDATGKPRCTNCGTNKTPRTTLDGTSTCVTKDYAGCKGADGALFMKEDKTCVLCSTVSAGADPNDQGIAGCKKCTKDSATPPTCSECLDGYYNSATGGSGTATCEACGDNCATCAKDTKDQCMTCKPGFFMKGSGPGTCVPCDDQTDGVPGCATCTFSSSLTCNSCKPNYKQSGTGPFTCTKTCEDPTACGGTSGACDAMIIDDQGTTKHYCSYCGETNKIPIDGKCVDSGSINGNTCAKGVCTQCAQGYFLYMGGCYKVASPPGNLMCTEATTAGVCDTPNANNKYFVVPEAKPTQQSVLACGNPLGTLVGTDSTAKAYVGVDGCSQCTAPTAPSEGGMTAATCTACTNNNKPNLAGSGCFPCTVSGCSHCNRDDMCEACSSGKKVSPGRKSCVDSCPSNSTDDNSVCVCNDGYSPDSSGTSCVSSGANRSGLSTGAIAGIAVAVVVVVGGLVGFLCWWFICRGKA